MKNIGFSFRGFALVSLVFLFGCVGGVQGCEVCEPTSEEVTECHSQPGYTFNYDLCTCIED